MSGFASRKFERDLEKAVEKAANEGTRKIGSDLQRTFDAVYPSHRASRWPTSALRRAHFTPSSEQLRSWSEAISEGTHIIVNVRPARLQ